MTSLSTPWTAGAPSFAAVADELLAHYTDLRRYLGS